MNESSLEILDLDAIQGGGRAQNTLHAWCGHFFSFIGDDSANQLLLTSPLVTHSLQLRLSSSSTTRSAVVSNLAPAAAEPVASSTSDQKKRTPQGSKVAGTSSNSGLAQVTTQYATLSVPKAGNSRIVNSTLSGRNSLPPVSENSPLHSLNGTPSLGLPSELLPSLSGSFGSDSERDTVQSALASALGMLSQHSAAEPSTLLSLGNSLDGEEEEEEGFLLSQSGKSLPPLPKDPEPSSTSLPPPPKSPSLPSPPPALPSFQTPQAAAPHFLEDFSSHKDSLSPPPTRDLVSPASDSLMVGL